ncbi:MAG TPA: CAP domain-containing protein [Solirubrobacterales bacterium]|nr:CAP domain-containing protein [Solirubrobacterales bacterium]
MTWRRRTLIAGTAFAAAALLAILGARAGTASAAGCPHQGDAGASAGVQERAMLCLVNRARADRGLDPLAAPASLARAADRKSADILRCDEFSHEACGRQFTYWIDRVGYRYCSAAENIAYAAGGYATPRTIFGLWVHSAGHRHNILGPYRDIGIGLRVGALGATGAHVWTQEFGSRNC